MAKIKIAVRQEVQERIKIVLFPGISGVSQKSPIVIRRRSRIEEVLGDISNQILPDEGIIVVVDGQNAFGYEFFPKNFLNSIWQTNYYVGFWRENRDPREENNLYPFLHLLSDENICLLLRLHTKLRGQRVSGDPGEDNMLSISVAVGSP